MAPICCSRSVAQSTTAHSVPGLGIDLTGSLMRTRPLPMRHDPPDPSTVPGELEPLLEKRLRAREALDREIATLRATLKSLDDNGSYGNGEDAGAPIGLR